jgi:ferritin-like metal-binding protein YciE
MSRTHNQDRFLLYLNSSLSMENAAYERLQRRQHQTTVEKIKEQLQLHLQETKEQQNRLMQLIRNMDGTPVQEKGELPISKPPEFIVNTIHQSATSAEQEVIQIAEDMIVENAEVIGYNLLIQMATKMNFSDTIPSLKQSLEEEEKMSIWLRTNFPAMFAKLWTEVESTLSHEEIESSSSPSLTK